MGERATQEKNYHLWSKPVEDAKEQLRKRGLDPTVIEVIRDWGMFESDEEHFAFSVDREGPSGKSMIAIVSYHYESGRLELRSISSDEGCPQDVTISLLGFRKISLVAGEFPEFPNLEVICFGADFGSLGKQTVLVNEFGGIKVENSIGEEPSLLV